MWADFKGIVSMLKVYDSTIRKSTEQDFLFEKVFERKPLFSEKHGSTVKLHLNKLQDLWIDETTQFGQNAQHHIWRKKVRAYEYKHPTLTARHGGGGVMIWAHFAAEELVCIPKHSQVPATNLQQNVWKRRCCNRPAKVQTSPRLKYCGRTWRELWICDYLKQR